MKMLHAHIIMPCGVRVSSGGSVGSCPQGRWLAWPWEWTQCARSSPWSWVETTGAKGRGGWSVLLAHVTFVAHSDI